MIASLKLLVIAPAAYIAVVAAMYFDQRKFQYFPDNKNLTPSTVGLADVEVVDLATEDGENIIGWYSPAKPARPTIIYFQGNGGEIGDRAERFAVYQARGMGALFVSYRGYGGSTGTPSERGLVLDAIAAYDWLAKRGVHSSSIVAVGESLGTGVAVQLATKRKLAALALEAPFASAADIAARTYWWLPVRLLMKDQFDSLRKIGRIMRLFSSSMATATKSSRSPRASACLRRPRNQRK